MLPFSWNLTLLEFIIGQGILLRTPLQWPHNRGFTFSCWLRVENFPRSGTMGLFSFLTENGRGCFSLISRDKLIYEVICRLICGICILHAYFMKLLPLHINRLTCNCFLFPGQLQCVNHKRHAASLHVNLVKKKWHYLCITHSIGRAFSGGSLLKCYLDGNIVSSEKCRCAFIFISYSRGF